MADKTRGVCVHGKPLTETCGLCPKGERLPAKRRVQPTQPTNDFLVSVWHELLRARVMHAPMHSHHEAYAVLLEELDEVWQEVKCKQPDIGRIVDELIQVAAMCNRWAEDVCGALPPTDERGR